MSASQTTRPSAGKKIAVGAAVVLSAAALVTGCTRAVDGTANKAGAGPRNNTAEETYPNLLKECDVLTSDVLATSVEADPLNIMSTFVGAICRWQALNNSGVLIDITRFWFEQGNLDHEQDVADFLNYQVESRSVAGVASIVMRPNDPNGSCGVASDAGGVVGWWVSPQAPGVDACAQALKLMELTLQTSA
ncbi:DUF3558 domain-containing protein [Mycolicibacterium brumae]|uniref:DUF3558 domain-containing protein n=1 Tax=Mycolicibacterium brumae TaxID=85968 RepID=A0A2G5PAN9_9MYCO|nr:DUF3558 domain-containing protein [Mycolicibacterium brumae]MCV7192143.1 DUF3558 domain-containing protein [Mycolicibacterium brumae]PIB75402.1 DUF3558 domain-containing protein [Mycolicibacterium brumae]RWA20808.1 hypothetical protein MBRU_03855 [Mycolicibacterium brumae DSM 44177]UWW07906.1 DUF3558 domain-containing protein [Mycolicibacterium brumae]